nr:asparaginase [Paenibacillus sp. MZ03-122A]
MRGEVIENVHYGAICVVDERGKVVHRAGDPEHMTFLRSAAKPFQAIPVLKRRIPEIYELTGGETALFAGSHRGEEYHIAALESMYKKIGIDENTLHCCATYPLNEHAKEARHRAREPKRRIFHNCSGKHAGLIALNVYKFHLQLLEIYEMSGDKNIISLIAAKIAAFLFYGIKFLSKSNDKNFIPLPILTRILSHFQRTNHEGLYFGSISKSVLDYQPNIRWRLHSMRMPAL